MGGPFTGLRIKADMTDLPPFFGITGVPPPPLKPRKSLSASVRVGVP
jgi:hypothetical protein